jgi:iron complex outermembrane recepter protein
MCKHQKPARQREMSLITRPKLIRMLCTGLGIGLVTIAAIAGADEAGHQYRIPAQSLDSSLLRLAADSGLEILFTADKVRGVTSNPVDGNMTPAQALSKLLQDSGMTYRFVDAKTVTVESPDADFRKTPNVEELPKPQSSSDTTLPKVTVEAESGNPYDDPSWANDPNNTDYNRPNANAATKTDTPLMRTPVSVQTVTRSVLNDQQVIKLEEAVRNVSGVQRSGSLGDEGGLYDNFVIRGFDSQFSNFRNGIRQPSFSFEPANVQQVEVLKGPAAILYGRIEPGGLINIVTRQPEAQAHYSLQQQFGSFDLYRTTLDATGPINKDKSVLYRFDLAYLDKGSFRDFGDKERIFLAPSITWHISDATQVNLNLEYQNDDQVDDPGIPALNGSNRPAPVPLNHFYGEPNFRTENDRKSIELAWSHAFNKDWTLRQRFQTSLTDYDSNNVWTAFVDADNRTLQRGYWRVKQERDTYGMNLDLLGHFDTFGINHNVLFGVDYYRLEQNAAGFADGFGFDANGDVHVSAPPIDIFNPLYGQASTPTENDLYFTNRQDWVGLYFQDQVNFFDTVHFLFGGRHDWATSGNGGSGSAWNGSPGGSLDEAEIDYDQNKVDAENFTPRLGLVYNPFKFLSLYANYVESFGLSNARTQGLPLPPQTARQYEGGIKTDFWDGRLSSTLAFFQIYKDNIATPDLLNPGFRRAIGQARSSGIEWDISGQLTDNWNLTASYALTDTRITKDNGGNEGNQLPNAAKHSANVWTRYLFDSGILQGLSLGTGVYLVSQRQANTENDLQLPGYVRWDASVGYQLKLGEKKLTTQLKVYNILDKNFYSSNDWIDANFAARTNIAPGAPLTFMGSVQLEF